MKVVGFIDSEASDRDILNSSGLWRDRKARPPPKALSPPLRPEKYPILKEPSKAEDFGDFTCGEFTEPVPDYDVVSEPKYDVCEISEWAE